MINIPPQKQDKSQIANNDTPQESQQFGQEVKRQLELRDIVRLITCTDVVPVLTPVNVQNQLQVVVTGVNASLYIYDNLTNRWWSATLT